MGSTRFQDVIARQYRRIDRIIEIDHERTSLRLRDGALSDERRRLVRENEEDGWLCDGGRRDGDVVSLAEYRNRHRFRVRQQPISHVA